MKKVTPPTREAMVLVVRNAEEQLEKFRARKDHVMIKKWEAKLARKRTALAEFGI